MEHPKIDQDELKLQLMAAMVAAVVRIPNGLAVVRSALEAVESVYAEMGSSPFDKNVIPIR